MSTQERIPFGSLTRLLSRKRELHGYCIDDDDDDHRDYWTRLALVALVIDKTFESQVETIRRKTETEFDMRAAEVDYAIIRHDDRIDTCTQSHSTQFGGPLSLFTVSAFSIAHAFYIMTADCCDPDHRKPEIFELDPEYYGVDIEIVLFNVGEKAGWIVDRLWDAFCEYRNDIWPYEIVPATTFHIKVENGRQRQGRA